MFLFPRFFVDIVVLLYLLKLAKWCVSYAEDIRNKNKWTPSVTTPPRKENPLVSLWAWIGPHSAVNSIVLLYSLFAMNIQLNKTVLWFAYFWTSNKWNRTVYILQLDFRLHITFIFFLSLFLSLRGWGAERERGRERESQAGSGVSAQSLVRGSIPWTLRSWAEQESRVGRLTTWAPQAPLNIMFIILTPTKFHHGLWSLLYRIPS